MVDRRRFLAGVGGLAGLALLAQSTPGAAATPSLPGHPFRLGVSSGDPTPEGVVLWTRLAPDPLAEDGLGGMPSARFPVRWEIAEDEAMTRVVRRGTVTALPELAHSVHVEVRGLRPGRDYWYRFAAGGELSATGHTRTAAAPHESVPVALAIASCQAWDAGFFTAYRHLATQDLDVVVHLGDWIYENQLGATGGVRGTPLSMPQRLEPMSLDQYRIRHALAATDPDLQAARRVLPFVVTIDDHEVKDNWSARTEPTGPTPENFLRRKAWALRACYEHMPLRAAALPRGTAAQYYRRLRFGRHGLLHMLDERQYRDPQDIGRRDDPARSMLGAAQEKWLLDGMTGTSATWNLIGNQVQMFQLDRLTDPGLQQLNPDTWDGYAASRDRVLRGIVDRRVRNPIVLTGDAHFNCAAELRLDFDRPETPVIAPELLGTSITSGGNGADLTDANREWLAANPHLKFANSQRGYVRCHADGSALRADYLVLDKVTTPDGVVSTRRSFVVESGRPELVEA